LSGVDLWRVRAARAEIEEISARTKRLETEAECWRLAKECYGALRRLDLAAARIRKEGGV
jgi:hypothetical protein